MANEEHLKIVRQGVEVWNRWREENPDVRPDLRGVDLREADLHGADLSGADLNSAKLNGANLREADLSDADLNDADLSDTDLSSMADLPRADLHGANLHGANLRRADLRGVDLSEADLSGADLSEVDLMRADLRAAVLFEADLRGAVLFEAHLRGANLMKADLSGAVAGLTSFDDLDLSAVKGLDTVRHLSPSTIGLDTIYSSHGQIPEAFLRGAGVPNTFIAYMGSLTGRAFEYYSCFISYSSKDQAFAQRLHADLQAKGVRCWFAPEDMKIGDKIRPRIDQAIRVHDKLLLVLSEHSINSAWVEKEVETAFEEETKRNKTVLFPVRLDATVMETDQAWAADIRRTRHIGDFCQWKDHDCYQCAFDRLLRDLKASEE